MAVPVVTSHASASASSPTAHANPNNADVTDNHIAASEPTSTAVT